MAQFLGGGSNSAGKYFEIRSKLNNLCLTVSGGLMVPGTPVVTWQDHPGDNQVWYEDPLTATIRSLQSHMCLQSDESKIVTVDLYDAKDPEQRWRINKDKGIIENILDSQKVLEVEAANKEQGTKIVVGLFADKSHQKYTLDFKPINYFWLSTVVNGNELYLEADASKPKVCTNVIFKPQNKNTSDQQLWYEDYQGNLRCKAAENLVLDGSKGNIVFGESGEKQGRNFWVYIGNRIVNKENYNEVAEVKGQGNLTDEDAKNSDQLELSVGIYLGYSTQHFKQEYIEA